KEKIDYDELMNCTRCGFCLPSCPTYVETGNDEVHSPRGRIALMKGVVDGVIEPRDEVKESIDLCLGCRACETACPSRVNFGRLLAHARDSIYSDNDQTMTETMLRATFFTAVFPIQSRMVILTSLVVLQQRTALQKIARGSGIMKFFP